MSEDTEKKPEIKPEIKTDASIDLLGVVCPMNFVKTKLELEKLDKGQILEITLDSGEPIQNVPKSIKEEGHKIVEVNKEGDHFRLKIEKCD